MLGITSISLALLLPLTFGTADDPTVEEVRAAVLDYIGDDVKEKRAKELLEEWGDAALPALRELAGGSFGPREGLRIVFCIEHVLTQGSVDLLVEILAGETKVDAGDALGQLSDCKYNGRMRRYLRKNEAFKGIAFRFAEDRSWLNRGQFAEIAAAMRWRDAVPLIEKMLEDENQGLRVTAAEALSRLTGEKVVARRREASFPGRRLVPGLIGEPEVLPTRPRRGDFTRDHAGEPRLIISGSRTLNGVGEEERPGFAIKTDHYCHGVLALPRGEKIECLLTLASDESTHHADYVSAIDRRGKFLWTWRPADSGVADIALLHTKEGVMGTIVSAESKLVALNHEGEILWKWEEFTPAYELLTHPELPGVLFVEFGDFDRIEVSAEGVELRRKGVRPERRVYSSCAELFPDAEGRPSLVAAGAGDESVPTVARFDERGKVLWRAILPGRIGELAMLEAPGRPRLLAITADTGQLYVLDENGFLLHEAEFPGESAKGNRPTYCLSAGEVSPAEWALYLNTLEGSYLYAIDLSAL